MNIGAKHLEVAASSYELEIAIDAPIERVWQALIDETNAWWLPDFHMVGPDSTVTFDTRAGGGLVEHLEGGGSLLWYTVHWCHPDQWTIYLVGQVHPDWGGPATSHLKLALEERSKGGCTLKVGDARLGPIDEANAKASQDGWQTLFSDGLKQFVEHGQPKLD